jgi:hypothetical protein
MTLVHPTLDSNIKHLKAEFIHNYHIGAIVFCVSLTNAKGEDLWVKPKAKKHWESL